MYSTFFPKQTHNSNQPRQSLNHWKIVGLLRQQIGTPIKCHYEPLHRNGPISSVLGIFVRKMFKAVKLLTLYVGVGFYTTAQKRSTYKINSRLFPVGVGRNYRTPLVTILEYSSRLIHIHTSGHSYTRRLRGLRT